MSDPALLEDTARPAPHVPAHATSTRVRAGRGTRPTYATHQRCQAPPPRTHAATQTPAAHPRRTCAPRTQERPERIRTPHAPSRSPETRFSTYGRRSRNSGNKISASAHGMGSGGLAVDAMAIGCLGVDRRVERFFSYLTIGDPTFCNATHCGGRVLVVIMSAAVKAARAFACEGRAQIASTVD